MNHPQVDLAAIARQEMMARGFVPDLPAAAVQQAAAARQKAEPGLQDLTGLLWSSLDNDDSRDLDQIEWAERTADGIRVLVGIADVDSAVSKCTPIDLYAAAETTTVYTGIRTFPMLPERLSTDQTSLNEGQDRVAVVIEMTVAADGAIGANRIYPCAGAESRAVDVRRGGSVAGGQGGDAGQGGRVGAAGGAVAIAERSGAAAARGARPDGRVDFRPRRVAGGGGRRQGAQRGRAAGQYARRG